MHLIVNECCIHFWFVELVTHYLLNTIPALTCFSSNTQTACLCLVKSTAVHGADVSTGSQSDSSVMVLAAVSSKQESRYNVTARGLSVAVWGYTDARTENKTKVTSVISSLECADKNILIYVRMIILTFKKNNIGFQEKYIYIHVVYVQKYCMNAWSSLKTRFVNS